jgi:hypothetical protein
VRPPDGGKARCWTSLSANVLPAVTHRFSAWRRGDGPGGRNAQGRSEQAVLVTSLVGSSRYSACRTRARSCSSACGSSFSTAACGPGRSGWGTERRRHPPWGRRSTPWTISNPQPSRSLRRHDPRRGRSARSRGAFTSPRRPGPRPRRDAVVRSRAADRGHAPSFFRGSRRGSRSARVDRSAARRPPSRDAGEDRRPARRLRLLAGPGHTFGAPSASPARSATRPQRSCVAKE